MTKLLGPLPLTAKSPVDAQTANSHRESHDAYSGLIHLLCDRWRFIICRHGMQFILQKRSSTTNTGVWLGKSFCVTREALIEVCSRLGLISSEFDQEMLDTLPNRARDFRQK